METAIHDQFVCRLRNTKTQRELLCIPDLTVQLVLRKACAAEAVDKETQSMRDSSDNAATLNINSPKTCFCCGKFNHMVANCKFKTAKCCECQRVGHLARMCMAKAKNKPTSTDKQSKPKSKNDMHQLEVTKVPVYH